MKASLVSYGSLLLAIFCEIVATTFLKQSEQFTRLVPSAVTLVGYAASFYLLSIALKAIPVGIAYALWSGIGIVAISIIGAALFQQALDFWAVSGIALILVGVVIVNLSKTSA